jgi:hypothetical protein
LDKRVYLTAGELLRGSSRILWQER